MEWIRAIVPSIIVSIVMLYWGRRQAKRDAKADSRAVVRKEESLLCLKVNMATAKMAEATALAVKRGKTNGEMTEALEELEAVKKEYYGFLNRQAKEHILEGK